MHVLKAFFSDCHFIAISGTAICDIYFIAQLASDLCIIHAEKRFLLFAKFISKFWRPWKCEQYRGIMGKREEILHLEDQPFPKIFRSYLWEYSHNSVRVEMTTDCCLWICFPHQRVPSGTDALWNNSLHHC